MNLSKQDRDQLRQKQQSLNQIRIIGNIIEHKTQNPRDYRKASAPQNDPTNVAKLNITYASKFMESVRCLDSIEESKEPELPQVCKEIRSDLWLNMDQVELDKLEWMTDRAQKAYEMTLKGVTRFDKTGKAIAESDKHLEGYDIAGLLKLLDSSYDPQVTFGLNTIARIASLAVVGYYDGAFDENIHEILLDNFLLRVRHHLDSPNETICLTALRCLRCLICNNLLDEVLLDRMHPLIYNSLDSVCWLNPNFPGFFPDDMKDSECVKLDAIMALVHRTDILNRLLHLLRTKSDQLKYDYYSLILDIMIRISRHSPTASSYIHLGDCFIPLLLRNLPMNVIKEKRDVQTVTCKILKLVRIVTKGTIQLKLEKRVPLEYELLDTPKVPSAIMPMLEAYFFIDCLSLPTDKCDIILKIHLETLRLLKTLSVFNQFIGRVKDILALGRDQILTHLKALANLRATKPSESTISFDWQYYAHLVDLIGFFMQREKIHLRDPFADKIWDICIRPLVLGWIKDICQSNIVPHLDVSIAIAATLTHYKNTGTTKDFESLRNTMIVPIINEHKEKKGRGSNIFKSLTTKAIDKSQLSEFMKFSGKLRDPKSLPSFGCLNFNSSAKYQFKLSPLFEQDSPFILLNAFIVQLEQEVNFTQETLRPFVDSVHLVRYIKSVVRYHKYPSEYESMVQDSFVTQYEVQMVGNALVILSEYYLYLNKVNEAEEEKATVMDEFEPAELRKGRVECYSNLLYYTISVVGLLDPFSPHMNHLKDRLFRRVLFNPDLHRRTSIEVITDMDKFFDYTITRHRKLSSSVYSLGIFPEDYINVLEPLYMNACQPNRFWIFQPLLGYISAEKKSPGWFKENLTERFRTGELITFEDSSIISIILLFNAVMIRFSPCYCRLVVQPDLEVYLCMVGNIFLDDDLFLDQEVADAIRTNLDLMFSKCLTTKDPPFQDSSRVIEPLGLPVKEIFNKLVDQFESVSYGSVVFSNFMYLFLTNKSDQYFRKKLFQEKVETCLSQLRLSKDDLWLPEELFFGEKEKDVEILAVMAGSKPYLSKDSFIDELRAFHTS